MGMALLLWSNHGRRAISLVLLCSIVVASAQDPRFNATTVLRQYSLSSGRPSACPANLSYTMLAEDDLFISVSDMTADGNSCTGPGGKELREDSLLRRLGLLLPSFTTAKDVSFFVGIESAPRVCGKWAFNASAISWFIYNGGLEAVRDPQVGLDIAPGFVYLTYEHFGDLCVFRSPAQELASSPSPTPSVSPSEQPATSISPSPSEGSSAETQDSDGGSVCFPGNAVVELEDRRMIPMSQLTIGDRVRSSSGDVFSDVYAFSHNKRYIEETFIRIVTASGHAIDLTSGHFLYVNGIPKIAGSARVGDTVIMSNGTSEAISRVLRVKGMGLYNPQTLDGDIVVNGILATTWTSVVSPSVASALLSALRFPYLMMPQVIGSMFEKYLPPLFDALRFARSESPALRELMSSKRLS